MSRGRRNPVLGPVRRWTLYSPGRLIAILACAIGLVVAISIATSPPPKAKHGANQANPTTSAVLSSTTARTSPTATPTPTALLVPTSDPPAATDSTTTPTSPHLTAVTAPPQATTEDKVPSETPVPTTVPTPVPPPAPSGPTLPPATAPGLDDPLQSDQN